MSVLEELIPYMRSLARVWLTTHEEIAISKPKPAWGELVACSMRCSVHGP
jgi:hypothetical protein